MDVDYSSTDEEEPFSSHSAAELLDFQVVCQLHEKRYVELVSQKFEDVFKADFLRTSVRKSQLRNLQSLQQLSLNCISDNISSFFLKKEDPFARLPSSILLLLAKFLQERQQCNPQLVRLLITPRSQFLLLYIAINFQKRELVWSDDSVDFIFNLIKKTCSGSLKTLVVYMAQQACNLLDSNPSLCVNSAHLNDLLGAMSALQKLSLRDCNVTDDTLGVIGSTCEQLSEVRLDWNHGISDIGIELLCNCTKLVVIKVLGTHVTADGLITALQNLPDLVKLDHCDLDVAVAKFAQTSKQTELKLKSLYICATSQVELLCKVMPHIESLSLDNGVLVSPLLQLKHVTKLSLYSAEISKDEFARLIIQFSPKLTSLEIMCCAFETDISLVGFYCLKLKKFILSSKLALTLDFELAYDEHFSQVQYIDLTGCELFRHSAVVFGVLLASQHLKHMVFHSMFFTPGVFDELVNKARAQERVFSNLETMTFHFCHYVCDLCLTKVCCVAPKLKKISGKQCCYFCSQCSS